MNINKIDENMLYWHSKYEKPVLKIKEIILIIFNSSNLLLKNYSCYGKIKRLKNFYYIAMYNACLDNISILGVYNMNKRKPILFDEIGISFSFEESITDKWMYLIDFKQFEESLINEHRKDK